MNSPHDRQVEHDLTRLGDALAERAVAPMPDRLGSALAQKRRALLTRRVALAAGVVFAAAGAVVVSRAVRTRTFVPPPAPFVRSDVPWPADPPTPSESSAPLSIAALNAVWQRTGEADPAVIPSSGEPALRAGDVAEWLGASESGRTGQ